MIFLDFFLTGCIIGNYRFFRDDDKQRSDFLNHQFYYTFICLTQVIDIVLNFFKIDHVRKRGQQDPFLIFKNYVKGNFLVDFIAVVPYSIVYPPFMILRYLKLLKFNTYLMYFEEFVFEGFSFMNPE